MRQVTAGGAWTVLVAATLAISPACGRKSVTCAADAVDCSGTCAVLAVDGSHCGACGNACGAGEACQAGSCTTCAQACHGVRGCVAGACQPDLMVACFASDEVRPLALDLSAAGAPRAVDDGPLALVVRGDVTWVMHGLSPTLLGLGPTATAPRISLGSTDLEGIRVSGNLVLVSNASGQSLVILNPGAVQPVADEVPLARAPGVVENPHGIAVVGDKAYVALYGKADSTASFASGQAVAVVGPLPASCAAPPCAAVSKRISLENLPGAYDAAAGGLPFAAGAVAVGSRVFVTLPHLKLATFPGGGSFYTDPAGSGRLLVIDTANGDAASVIDLGAGCTNPGAAVASGSTVWVACGGTQSVVRVEAGASITTPVAATPIPVGVTSGGLAFCGARGYVTDQFSGKVVAFDPAGLQPSSSADVCPVYPPPPAFGFAFASDVTCAP